MRNYVLAKITARAFVIRMPQSLERIRTRRTLCSGSLLTTRTPCAACIAPRHRSSLNFPQRIVHYLIDMRCIYTVLVGGILMIMSGATGALGLYKRSQFWMSMASRFTALVCYQVVSFAYIVYYICILCGTASCTEAMRTPKLASLPLVLIRCRCIRSMALTV